MKKSFGKILKRVGIGLLALFLVLVAVGWYLNEAKPVAKSSAEADSLAKRMLKAVGNDAWQQTALVKWTYAGGHDFVWDKKRNLVSVSWQDNRVLLNLNDWPKGQAFVGNVRQTGEQVDVLRGKAWAFFCNDSFWLIAPTKILDKDTERSLVPQADGSNALLVTYKSGGVTPGDSYLWFLDRNGLPTRYKMWVSIIPIGGVEATWEDWQPLSSGALVATKHKLGPLTLKVENLKSGSTIQDLGLKEDLFLGVL